MAFNNNMYGGMTLKALLENPDLQHAPAALSGAPSTKAKKDGSGTSEFDFSSAFLGPNLWDKTYDNDFNLEYMDLDEFLSENGIPVVDNPNIDQLVRTPSPASSPADKRVVSPRVSPPQSPLALNVPAASPSHTVVVPPVMVRSPGHFLVKPEQETTVTEDAAQKKDVRAESPGAVSTCSTPPVSPLPVHVEFKLTEQDIVLSSVPGQSMFDPTAHNFTEDELKPQPMIKKSKKVFVPDDLKDDKYWARRKKNNHAAKRSRDARRIKENQIAMRAAYLEKENGTIRDEMEKMRRENARLKHRLSKYEPTPSS